MKRLSLNMIVAVACNILTIIFSIIAQRFVLVSFGSEINGLTASIAQFMTYFALLESGLGLASIQALYRPFALGDKGHVSRILAATSKQYHKIGIGFFVLTVSLAFAMPFISESSLNPAIIFKITVLSGMPSVISYSFIGRYQTLLSADRKEYLINALNACLGIGFNVVRIIMINLGCSITTVLAAVLFSPLIRFLFLHYYVRRHYDYAFNNKEEPDFKAIAKRKNVLIHQIVGLITNQSSVALLTVFSTLNEVSKYSVYNLIYSHLFSVINSTFSTATQASFGRWIECKDARLDRYYEIYETLFTCALFCLMSVVCVVTIPFVSNYTHGVKGVDYIDGLLALLFMISSLFSTSRIPAMMMINATGSFAETQKGAIGEAILSITISIPAFFILGIRGVVFGTCVAIFYRMLDIERFVYHNILHTSIKRFVKLIVVNSSIMISYIALFMVFKSPTANGWIAWLLLGVKQMIIAILLFGTACGVVYGKRIYLIWKEIRYKYM